MRYLITGGSGFVGTHLISQLLNEDNESQILNIDLVQSNIKDKRVQTIIADIRNLDLIKLVDAHEQIHVCIHLAALCKEPGFDWDEYFETNYAGTKNVLNLCSHLNIKKVLFTSTMMVYRAGEERRNERSLTSPDTAYGISKLLAEKELQKWAAGMSERYYCTLRPSVVFGKYEKGNFTRLYYALKGNRFAFVGRKSTVKSCVYVKDLCNALIFFMENKKPRTYNFAFIQDYSIGQIVLVFKEVFNLKSYTPVIPIQILLPVARIFKIFDSIGIKNPIHPRRIQKLYYSTNIDSNSIINDGFVFTNDLHSALLDWKHDCNDNKIF
ncbi:MAG: NAD(P)-dependent oxidoreductase [Cyclobacteriaceae bacterium]